MTRRTGRSSSMYTYIVSHWSRGSITVQAKDATQAKRIACRMFGVKLSDSWCGLSCFKARRLKY